MTKKEYVLEARSKKNGIVFYSNICPMYRSETYIDKTGIIHSRIISAKHDEAIFNSEILTINGNPFFNKRILLAFDAILITTCLSLKNPWYICASIYFSIVASSDLFSFIKYAYLFKLSKSEYRSSAKYHAAEHMVLNAYIKFQRIPTFKEVKQSSIFSKYCGSRIIYHNLIYSILISCSIAFILQHGLIIYYTSFIFITLLMAIAEKKGLLKFLQIFVTTPPSNVEIKVVLEGIKAFEKMEEILNNLTNSVTSD